MEKVIEHAVLGTIVYTEGFWFGQKSLYINGIPMQKLEKNTFLYLQGTERVYITVKGNAFTGVKLLIEGEEIQVVPSAKWYEIACSVFIFCMIMIWGNSTVLCSIVPVVGGAIGGGISGLMSALNMAFMKSTKNVGLKLVIWVGMTVLTFLICFGLGAMILNALM